MHRHAMGPSDNIFFTRAIFLIFVKNAKKENRQCPLPYEEALEAIINSLSASLLLNIFLSFEVGIAHAIANFKWKENTSSLKN